MQLQLLGGVPMMIHSKDMSDTLPDEKVISCCNKLSMLSVRDDTIF